MLDRSRTDRERTSAYSGLATVYQRQGRYAEALDAQEAEWATRRTCGDAGMALTQQAFSAGEYARAGLVDEPQQLVAKAKTFTVYEAPSFYRANVEISEAYLFALAGDPLEA